MNGYHSRLPENRGSINTFCERKGANWDQNVGFGPDADQLMICSYAEIDPMRKHPVNSKGWIEPSWNQIMKLGATN